MLLDVHRHPPTVDPDRILQRIGVSSARRNIVEYEHGKAFRDEVKVARTGAQDRIAGVERFEPGLLRRGEVGRGDEGGDEVWDARGRGEGGVDVEDRVGGPCVCERGDGDGGSESELWGCERRRDRG